MITAAASCVLFVFAAVLLQKPRGNELFVYGDELGNYACVNFKGQAYTMPHKAAGKSTTKKYLDSLGATQVHADEDGYFLDLEGTKIEYATNKTAAEDLEPADYLIVDGKYKGDLEELLNITKPKYVFAGANMKPARKAELAALSQTLKISYSHTINLSRRAVLIEF